MMKMQTINVFQAFGLICLMMTSQIALGQSEETQKEKETEKVIIVETKVDEEGNTVTEERILEGEEAREYLIEKELEVVLEEEFDMEELKQQLEEEQVRIVEIQRELTEEMENFNIDIDENNGNFKIRIDRDGEVFEWEGDGEWPQELIEELDELDIDLPEMPKFEHESIVMIQEDMEERAVLGVMVENVGGNGALVKEVFDESGAEKAGLQSGDIIYNVDGEKVSDVESLVGALKGKSVGDEVKVKYMRDGKKKKKRVVLGQMRHKMHHKPAHGYHKNFEFKCDPSAVAKVKCHPGKKKVKKVVVVKAGPGDEQVIVVDDSDSDRYSEIELQELKVYPNPGEGVVNLEFEAEAVPTTITVLSMDGKELLRRDLPEFNGTFSETLDIERQDGGVILQIQQDGKIFTETILK